MCFYESLDPTLCHIITLAKARETYLFCSATVKISWLHFLHVSLSPKSHWSFDSLAFCWVVSFGVCQALLVHLLTYPTIIQQSNCTVQICPVKHPVYFNLVLLEACGAEMGLILIVQNDMNIQWICSKHMFKHRGNSMAKSLMMLLLAMASQSELVMRSEFSVV